MIPCCQGLPGDKKDLVEKHEEHLISIESFMLLEDPPNFYSHNYRYNAIQSKSQKMSEWNQAISKIYMDMQRNTVKTLLNKNIRGLAPNIVKSQ